MPCSGSRARSPGQACVNVQFPYGADHGALFTQAVVMFLMSLALVWIHREEMPLLALRRSRE